MNIVESVNTCINKYFVFKGFATRSEFWWFQIFISILISTGITLDGNWDNYNGNIPPTETIPGNWEAFFTLIIVIPAIAVSCRRLHDLGKSGWWQLIVLTIIGIIPLIYWYCQEGTKEFQKKKEIHKEFHTADELKKWTEKESQTTDELKKWTEKEFHGSSADELKKWLELKDLGAITEKEFQKKKKELIK